MNKRIAVILGTLVFTAILGAVFQSNDESSRPSDIKGLIFVVSMLLLIGFAGLKLAEITPREDKLFFILPRWARIIAACYAVALVGIIIFFVVTIPWPEISAVEFILENFYWYVIVVGVIAFPFMAKYLK